MAQTSVTAINIESPNSPTISSSGSDLEKSQVAPNDSVLLDQTNPSHYCSFPIAYNRPQSSKIISDIREITNEDKRILVMACGPAGLMKEIRHDVAGCSSTPGAEIELHCEQFGW